MKCKKENCNMQATKIGFCWRHGPNFEEIEKRRRLALRKKAPAVPVALKYAPSIKEFLAETKRINKESWRRALKEFGITGSELEEMVREATEGDIITIRPYMFAIFEGKPIGKAWQKHQKELLEQSPIIQAEHRARRKRQAGRM